MPARNTGTATRPTRPARRRVPRRPFEAAHVGGARLPLEARLGGAIHRARRAGAASAARSGSLGSALGLVGWGCRSCRLSALLAASCGARALPLLDALHRLGELSARAAEALPQGIVGEAEHPRDLLLFHPLDADEQEHLARRDGQLLQRALEQRDGPRALVARLRAWARSAAELIASRPNITIRLRSSIAQRRWLTNALRAIVNRKGASVVSSRRPGAAFASLSHVSWARSSAVSRRPLRRSKNEKMRV